MNLDLEEQLKREAIAFERITKSEKVRLLARWTRAFPELVAVARHGKTRRVVVSDKNADGPYGEIRAGEFYILPDDDSGMPSCSCISAKPPDLSGLVTDTFTKCEELVVVGREFCWSAVFVNHGAALVGKHFSRRSTQETG